MTAPASGASSSTGGDLSDDGAGHAQAGAGEAEHEHDQGDGVEGVTPAGDGLGSEQPPVGRPGQDLPQPWPLGSGHGGMVPGVGAGGGELLRFVPRSLSVPDRRGPHTQGGW